jgi:glycosyltransferase involved in cell wall biosynthesis
MHPLKGTFEFFEYVLQNPNLKFVLAGWTDNHCLNFLARTVPNVEYIGTIKYEKMPDLYNKYKTFFYTPNLNEPFCRSVAEAISCGMQLISNENNKIGCLEEIKKVGIENFKLKCSSADSDFWNLV